MQKMLIILNTVLKKEGSYEKSLVFFPYLAARCGMR